MRTISKAAQAELAALKRADGKLMPADVVKRAKSKGNPLHGYFTWDDTRAAHAHRLWQARELITVAVTVLGASNRSVQQYVSIESDRTTGGGYRDLNDVLTDAALREEMLQTAFREMSAFRARYKMLKELADVFAVMEKTETKLSKKKKKAA